MFRFWNFNTIYYQLLVYESAVIVWRHDIHQNPELSNREFRIAKLIADHLKSLELDVVETRFRAPFYVDDSVLKVGIRLHAYSALDYLHGK